MYSDDTKTNHEDQTGTMGAESTGTAVMEEESSSLIRDLENDVTDTSNLDLLLDVNLQVSVELGRAGLKSTVRSKRSSSHQPSD